MNIAQTMKMIQLNIDGVDTPTPTPVPDIFEPDLRGRHLHGRPMGAKGVVTEHRHVEAARLAVIGESLPGIAEHLGVGRTRAGQIVREAEELGIVEDLSAARSKRVKEMSERRYTQASAAMDIVQARLNSIKTDIANAVDNAELAKSLDARAVNDAFRALDRTEYTADGAVKMQGGASVHIDKLALFTPEAIQAAQADSDRVYGN